METKYLSKAKLFWCQNISYALTWKMHTLMFSFTNNKVIGVGRSEVHCSFKVNGKVRGNPKTKYFHSGEVYIYLFYYKSGQNHLS